MSEKKKEFSIKNDRHGHYVLRDEDAILINRILARLDRFIDIYERNSNIEQQRFEADLRDSMSRAVARAEQKSVLMKAASYLESLKADQLQSKKDSAKSIKGFERYFKPQLSTKGKKITAKDKRV